METVYYTVMQCIHCILYSDTVYTNSEITETNQSLRAEPSIQSDTNGCVLYSFAIIIIILSNIFAIIIIILSNIFAIIIICIITFVVFIA